MVSIIFPCYNSSPWVAEAIESVLAQTEADWELVVVDDGSTDATVSIVNRYVAADSRIRLIRESHSGVAHIRNVGIDAAKGEYIAFLDSDDLLPSLALATMKKVMLHTGSDIVITSFVEFDDGEDTGTLLRDCDEGLRGYISENTQTLSPMDAVRLGLYQTGIHSSLSAKLYRRFLFEGNIMRDGEIYEDLDYFYRVTLKARSVAAISLPGYLYRQRKGSIIHTFGRERLDVLKVTERLEKFVTLKAPELKEAARDRRFSANFNMLVEITRHLKRGDLSAEDREFFIKKREELAVFLNANARREIADPAVRRKNKIGAWGVRILPFPLIYKLISLFK